MELLDGELLDLTSNVSPLSSRPSDDEINEKYYKGEVRIVTEQARYPLHTIVTMLDSGNYELNPEFQRRHRWNDTKKSRLIESLIMNVPIPPIFLYEVHYSQYEVMDGLQRLTAISDFYKSKFKLIGLDQWPELNGFSYKTLPDQVRRGVDRRYLSSIILLQETARDPIEADRLKQLVFERINSGGEILEPQESRNALYNGRLNKLCIELARHDSFCKMWGIPTDQDVDQASVNRQSYLFDYDESEIDEAPSDDILHKNTLYKKMQDVELVLRFFAYRQLQQVEHGRLRDFLDLYLKHGNFLDREVLDALANLFMQTSDLIYEVLGEKAFCLFRKKPRGTWIWFDRPTKVLYDPMMYAFSNFIHQKKSLLEQKHTISTNLKNLYKEKESAFKGRSTNKEDILKRMEIINDFIAGYLE